VEEMTTNGLRDYDRLDGASNYVIWKERMAFLLYEHSLKTYVENVVVVSANVDLLNE